MAQSFAFHFKNPYRRNALSSSFTFAITASKSPCVGGSLGVSTKSETVFGFRAVPVISFAIAFVTSVEDTSPIGPISPAGIVNDSSTMLPFTVTETAAPVPAIPVITEPIWTLENGGPCGPTGPAGPAGPAGIASMSALSAVSCARISAEELGEPLAGFVGSNMS